MNKAEQRAAAKELYMLGWEQGRIARFVSVTEATLSAWVNKGDEGTSWKEQRAKKLGIEESISNQLLELIDYQLTVIRGKVKEWRESENPPLIGKGEIDALSKMFASVKQKDISWTHYMNVCRELSDYISSKDPDFAKSCMEFIDGFLIIKKELLTK